MSISELRDDLQARLADFLWDQWGQMGVFTAPRRIDEWAADPEALLLLSFEVGRGEPRLFEQVLDWLVVNERLISVQRLRNVAVDDADRALVEAALGWLGRRRRRPRLGAKAGMASLADRPEPFFRGSPAPFGEPDEAFREQGLLWASVEPSGNSAAPDLRLSINFAFRLRALLGIGARAEVARVLLTADEQWLSVQSLADSTVYSKRNVQEALSSLEAAGVLGAQERANEYRFDAQRARWMSFLDLDRMPRHEDWPRLFAAYRLILRWLWDPRNQQLSDYMLASEARTLVERVAPDLRLSGIPIDADFRSEDAAFLRELAERLREHGPI